MNEEKPRGETEIHVFQPLDHSAPEKGMAAKPLSVRVAEALTGAEAESWHFDEFPRLGVHASARCSWALRGACPPGGCEDEDEADGPWWMSGAKYFQIPSYDTDWAVTGPLIKPYTAGVHRAIDGSWNAMSRGLIPRIVNGPDPLMAVCNLILVLASEDMLKQWRVSV